MRLARLATARTELLWAMGTFAGAFAICETTRVGDYLLRLLFGWTYAGERRSWRGLKDGKGTLCFDGNVHVGHFRNGVPEGPGILRHADGSMFEGVFENGELNGHGTLRTASGDTYIGGFRGSKPDGRGTLRTSSGVYDGAFSEGRPVGCFCECSTTSTSTSRSRSSSIDSTVTTSSSSSASSSSSSGSSRQEDDSDRGRDYGVCQVPSLFTLAVAALTPASRTGSPSAFAAPRRRCDGEEASDSSGHHVVHHSRPVLSAV